MTLTQFDLFIKVEGKKARKVRLECLKDYFWPLLKTFDIGCARLCKFYNSSLQSPFL